MMIFKDRRVILFTRFVQGLPTVIKRKRVRPATDKVTFRKLTFIFDIGKPSFRTGRIYYYIVDTKQGQLFYSPSDCRVSPELTDTILTRNIAKQLVAGLTSMPLGTILIYILLAIGCGFGFGWIVHTVLL